MEAMTNAPAVRHVSVSERATAAYLALRPGCAPMRGRYAGAAGARAPAVS
jgi:hypothetical protein